MKNFAPRLPAPDSSLKRMCLRQEYAVRMKQDGNQCLHGMVTQKRYVPSLRHPNFEEAGGIPLGDVGQGAIEQFIVSCSHDKFLAAHC